MVHDFWKYNEMTLKAWITLPAALYPHDQDETNRWVFPSWSSIRIEEKKLHVNCVIAHHVKNLNILAISNKPYIYWTRISLSSLCRMQYCHFHLPQSVPPQIIHKKVLPQILPSEKSSTFKMLTSDLNKVAPYDA